MATECEIDPVLVERFAHGNGTVFVGAGISSGSWMPLWKELMEPLRRDLGKEADPSTGYLEIAELYETKYNRGELARYLQESLGDVRFQLTKTHELIVSLPVQRIYTTNFDDLLEQASHKMQINRTVISNASQVGFSDTSKLSIIKLHGDLNNSESLVVTAGDYYSYFTKNPAVADLLKVELQTHTVLFLGYSFSDFDLGMILGEVASQSGETRPLLYTLLLRPSRLTVQALARRGVKVIPLRANRGSVQASEMVEAWLRSFAKALHRYERRKRYLRVTSSKVGDNFDIPQYKRTLVRSETLRRIDEGLHSEFRVIVVKGKAGIGKTQLVASAVANSLEATGPVVVNEVFEREIWIRPEIDAKGRLHTLERILRAITSSIQTLSATKAEPAVKSEQIVNRLLQEHKVVVVIEDLERPTNGHLSLSNGNPGDDSGQRDELEKIMKWLETPIRYASPNSRIIVTSRNLSLPGFVVEVAPLTQDQARTMVKQHANDIMLRRSIRNGLTDAEIGSLAECTLGNPQVIKMALGLVNGTKDPAAVVSTIRSEIELHHASTERVFDALVQGALQQMELDAHEVLAAMLAFPESEPIPPRYLRKTCGIGGERRAIFERSVDKCVELGLVDRNIADGTLTLHRITKESVGRYFATSRLPAEAQARLAKHLLDFLGDGQVIRRAWVADEYWNALVRGEMAKVDPYWRIIKHVMRKSTNDPIIADFIMLLTHYMDSRFLNDERTEFLGSAIKVLNKLEQTDETKRKLALLRIDALAWTHIEEEKLDEASEEINRGRELIDKEKDLDLLALAECWTARIESARNNWSAAEQHLNRAFAAANKLENKEWIQMRVKMMAGDFRKMINEPEEAIRLYEEAENLAECYGGEGDGYQTSPRIGIALLDLKDERAEEKAEQRFRKLVDNQQIAIGQLYGRYGIALIAARKHSTREAMTQLRMIRQEIYHRGSGNVLLKMTQALYEEIRNRVGYTT